jgi:hypothetical protein
MGIDPKDFQVSNDSIRKRLGLADDSIIVPFGYEGVLDQKILDILKTRFDSGSMFIRTRPDFFVIEKNEIYFVEAKQRTKNVEAIQLLYNKFYERCGIKVVYSFPEVAIRASMIPMERVIIPENYRGEFDVNLKHLFEEEGVSDFWYVGYVSHGSGDAFVAIDVDDLKIMAEEYMIQENI